MTSSIRDITYQLRQGHLIALADETGWSVAADPLNDAAVERLLALTPADTWPTVLIDQATQLSLYLTTVPDVAWDLVEFAENPLTVIYDGGKNLSPVFLTNRPQVAIRRALAPEIIRLIGGFGKGLLTIPFDAKTLPDAVASAVTDRFGSPPATVQLPRILTLGVSGEIKFLRK